MALNAARMGILWAAESVTNDIYASPAKRSAEAMSDEPAGMT